MYRSENISIFKHQNHQSVIKGLHTYDCTHQRWRHLSVCRWSQWPAADTSSCLRQSRTVEDPAGVTTLVMSAAVLKYCFDANNITDNVHWSFRNHLVWLPLKPLSVFLRTAAGQRSSLSSLKPIEIFTAVLWKKLVLAPQKQLEMSTAVL